MENIQNNSENKKTILVTVVAGIVVLAALVWWVKQAQAPEQIQVSPMPTPDAETTSINQDVDSINVGDLNTEFDAIDKDLKGL